MFRILHAHVHHMADAPDAERLRRDHADPCAHQSQDHLGLAVRIALDRHAGDQREARPPQMRQAFRHRCKKRIKRGRVQAGRVCAVDLKACFPDPGC